MEIANQKRSFAFSTYNITKDEILSRPFSDFLESIGYAGGTYGTINGAGSFAFTTPWSAAVLQAVAALAGATAGYASYKQMLLKAEADAQSAYNTYQIALLDWEQAQLEFEKSLADCGSCP